MRLTISYDYVIAGVFGFLISLSLCASVFFYETPAVNCPSEDSCYADYSSGTWHIIPGERP